MNNCAASFTTGDLWSPSLVESDFGPTTPPQAAPQQQPLVVSSQAVMLEAAVASIVATERELGTLGASLSAVTDRFEALDKEHQRLRQDKPAEHGEAIAVLCGEKEQLARQEERLREERRRLARR